MKDPDFMTVAELQSALKKSLLLLSLAKCPNCDGSGATPVQTGPDDWEQEQCQWCHEKWELAQGD